VPPKKKRPIPLARPALTSATVALLVADAVRFLDRLLPSLPRSCEAVLGLALGAPIAPVSVAFDALISSMFLINL
jgi:hypothetical protein